MQRILFNKYTFGVSIFILISTFGNKSLISRCTTAQQIKELELKAKTYKDEIQSSRHTLKELQRNPKMLEKFAREKYFMKNDNEDVFIIIEN